MIIYKMLILYGLIGLKKYNLNKLVTPDELSPNYLRKSQAERLKK